MLWFRAHRYGWGWSPVTWQGWVATSIYIVAVVAWLVYRQADRQDELTLGVHFDVFAAWPVFASTAIFITVCWIKGERPRWRWGK